MTTTRRALTRRELFGSMAALPFLPSLASLQGLGATRKGRSLIVVWLDGGMSHIDTFDGKPEASPDIRGDLEAVPSKTLEGVFISKQFEKLDPLMGRCALIRSITHGEGNHDRGTHFLLTGQRPSQVLTYPSIGATASLRVPTEGSPLPSYVCIPDAPRYGGSGFLPATLSPFEVGGDPARGDFAVRNLAPRNGRGKAVDLLRQVDALDGQPQSAAERARDRFLAQARALSLDANARDVFDLRREKSKTRERYGRRTIGQSCLLARRLVEGGSRVVVVRDRNWDHHANIRSVLAGGFFPKLKLLDDALSALISDLDERGLSDRVTVVLASEFGRTPRMNGQGGRDHWPRAQSVLMFGAGIKRGVVHGETDARGEEPKSHPLSPADLTATLLHLLGVDGKKALHTPDGRPIQLYEHGAKSITEVLA